MHKIITLLERQFLFFYLVVAVLGLIIAAIYI